VAPGIPTIPASSLTHTQDPSARRPVGLEGRRPLCTDAAVLRGALQQVTHRNGALRQDAKTQKPTKCVLNELGSKTMHLEQTLLIQKGFKKCVEMPNLCGCFARKQMETQERKCQPA